MVVGVTDGTASSLTTLMPQGGRAFWAPAAWGAAERIFARYDPALSPAPSLRWSAQCRTAHSGIPAAQSAPRFRPSYSIETRT